jgi:chloride channel 3/4/5
VSFVSVSVCRLFDQRLDLLPSEDALERKKCSFSNRHAAIQTFLVDFSGSLEESVLQLRKELPVELVVSMFQKLVRSSAVRW